MQSASFALRAPPPNTTAAPPPNTSSLQFASRSAATKAMAKRFCKFIQQAKQHPQHFQNNLDSYLILAVQRLPRYVLLMNELMDCTPETHPDYAGLKKAREEMKKRVTECNEKMREWETRESGLEVLKRIKLMKWSVGGDILRHVRPGMRFVREGTLRVVKAVEFLGSSAGSPLLDAVAACGGKKDRCKKTIVGHLIETRFVGKGESTEPAAIAGSLLSGEKSTEMDVINADIVGGATAVYGLAKSTGRRFKFFLFTDLLCWCRALPDNDGDFELVRAFRIHPGTRAESRSMEADHKKGKAKTIVKESVMRVGDGECIVYVRGTSEEVEDWTSSFSSDV
ncbi:hypothetical protein HDV00_001509 [Rhizophlyctis rosea]|nr:hypothetical protein HDV00_001509 [Rhizophlyctis rosea]